MSDRLAYALMICGIMLIASGCANPLGAAVATANAAAAGLRVTHAELAENYRADQIEAAARVQGDRSDPSVRAEQRDRVEAVRDRYADAWSAYSLAREAWVSAVAMIDVAISAFDAGGLPAMSEVGAQLLQLARAQRAMYVAARALAGE